MHLFYVAVVCCWGGGCCAPPQPPPHHEICTSSPTPAPATKSHFKANPLRQNTFSTNQPTNQPTNPCKRIQPKPQQTTNKNRNQNKRRSNKPSNVLKGRRSRAVSLFSLHSTCTCFTWLWSAAGGGRCAPQPPPHHEICTSSPTPAPATKSHFKVNPLQQNTFSTNQPSPRGGEPSPPCSCRRGRGGGGPHPPRSFGGGVVHPHRGTMKVPTMKLMSGLSKTTCPTRRTPSTMMLVTMVKKSQLMSMANQPRNLTNSLNNMIMPMRPTWTPGRGSSS